MPKVKDFILALPSLCGVKDETDAKRYTERNKLIYESEASDKEGKSPFARGKRDEEIPFKRIKFLFGFDDADGFDEAKTDYCKKLLELAVVSHYINEHGELEYEDRAAELFTELLPLEKLESNSEIASVLTVDEAMSTSGWNG